MKIIVTGASGFIGKRVVGLLAKQDCDVVGVGRSRLPSANYEQVADYHNVPQGDVLIHLAESSSTLPPAGNHASYIDRVCDLAKSLCRRPYKKYIYVSSMAVYNDNQKGLLSVNDEVKPKGVYATGKRACEQIFLEQDNATVARLANVYGVGMSPHNVISTILQQLNNPAKIITLKNLSPVRDFIWIDDVSRGICSMAANSHSGIYNIGTGIGTSIKTLCETILKASGKNDFKIIAEETAGADSNLVLDITKTMDDFSWEPEIDLATGIKMLLKAQK